MRPAERRRERWILLHIFLISCLLLTASWLFFGVIPPAAEWNAGFWRKVYWSSEDQGVKAEALRHLMTESGNRANRTFSNAARSSSVTLQTLAAQWFSLHDEQESVEPSW